MLTNVFFKNTFFPINVNMFFKNKQLRPEIINPSSEQKLFDLFSEKTNHAPLVYYRGELRGTVMCMREFSPLP